MREFEVIVVGGGHAGAEAAAAAARLGAATALVTLSRATIAQMSCNPAIGGVGKGQMVREIDAMGGLMGLAADATGIQFRMLNLSKGPAVWGPRCQSDRHAYAAWVADALATTPNLAIVEGEAIAIVVAEGRVAGVELLPAGASAPRRLAARAVVLTTGTFLNGLMHQGPHTWPGGRCDEPAACRLSDSLRRHGIELRRLKTGTCPRIDARTIDHLQCTRQDGDRPPRPFSFLNRELHVEQLPCWLTQTTPAVHDAVRANLDRAPMFTGQIQAPGPRYCPSLETKIVRFPDKTAHQVFLEPEGRSTDWVYCNGLSTSLPVEAQEAMLRHVPGLQNARVLRWGYAIEYDYAPPTQITADLQAKALPGLFMAGQINGTTGYEEAAAQGLIAGANAALALAGKPAIVLRRDQAYIGVMIDDLVTKGITEPYRMFTSRAEHRLSLRADNADRRLTQLAHDAGLIDSRRWNAFQAELAAFDRACEILKTCRIAGRSVWELLRRPEESLQSLAPALPAPLQDALAQLRASHPAAPATAAIDARYDGYLAKEQAAMRHMRDLDSRIIPASVDYWTVPHLRHEARENLSRIRPGTLGQALRISGITPADVTVLAIHLAARPNVC